MSQAYLKDGVYVIRNLSSGGVMTAGVGTTSTGNPQIVCSQLSYTLLGQQLFAVKSIGNNVYSILNPASKKVIDLQGSAPDNLTPIISYPNYWTPNQKWIVKPITGGYQLQNESSQKYADLTGSNPADGTPVINYQETKNPNQTWVFFKIPCCDA